MRNTARVRWWRRRSWPKKQGSTPSSFRTTFTRGSIVRVRARSCGASSAPSAPRRHTRSRRASPARRSGSTRRSWPRPPQPHSSCSTGRFVFGVGSGEALNEHILGHRWPPVDTRLEMLEEAVEVIRKLWEGGLVTHHGRYYTVENARIYSLPDSPPPILVSAFGPDAADVAARIGDGFVTVQPDGGTPGSIPRRTAAKGRAIAALKVCWGEDEQVARKLAYELWPTEGVEGQLAQELALPSHFEAAAANVTEEMVAEQIACGPDPERHMAAINKYLEAGFDEVYINQIGPDQEGFFRFYERELAISDWEPKGTRRMRGGERRVRNRAAFSPFGSREKRKRRPSARLMSAHLANLRPCPSALPTSSGSLLAVDRWVRRVSVHGFRCFGSGGLPWDVMIGDYPRQS